MNDFKSIIASRTVWAAAIAFAAFVAATYLHVNISADDQNQIVNIALDVVQGVGTLAAIWGRVAATKQVTVTGKPTA
jgi:cytochrome b561